MVAKIIAQNHDVTSYTVTNKRGITRKLYIVEPKPVSQSHDIVNRVIESCCSREWATVYNKIDNNLGRWIAVNGEYGFMLPDEWTPSLEKAVSKLTY